MHRPLLIAIMTMVIGGALLSLAQLWLPGIIPWEFFIKIIITLGVLTALAALILVLVSDLGSHKKMKDDNYLD